MYVADRSRRSARAGSGNTIRVFLVFCQPIRELTHPQMGRPLYHVWNMIVQDI